MGVPVLKVLPVFEVKGLRFVPTGPGVLGALAKLMVTWSTMEVKEKAVRGCKAAMEALTMLLTWELHIAGWSTTFWIRSKWFLNQSRSALEIN